MKRHLTEKEIIEFQFNLASDKQAEAISEHLKGCGVCRKQAEQLKRKFAALDLLKQEPELSDKLIAETVEQTSKVTKPTVLPFKRPAWMIAAAAVILIGLVLLIPNLVKDKKQDSQIAKDIRTVKEEVKFDRRLDKKKPFAKQVSASRVGTEMGSIVAERITEAEVPDKPPFAPASAIELVTLPRRDDVQVTIYNSADLTLVRERRKLTLKKGWNWLQFMWANTLIDPTSLSLQPLTHGGKIDIQQLVFLARLRDIGRWLIRSEIEGQVSFEITYFTSGLSWRAFYMGTLSEDERKMQLAGYVRVANKSGEDYENAQTRLIVGKVHQLDKIAELARRKYPYNMPGIERDISGDFRYLRWDKDEKEISLDDAFGVGGRLGVDELRRKEIKKEGLSEYFLYTIEGTETIPDKWGKRLMSFDVDDIEVKSLYKYDEERWGKQAIRFVSFANDQEHNLGETPIPNGNVRIYGRADTDGHLSYVGGTNVKYIPVNEEVELNLGFARLVKVEPVLMDFKTANFVFDKKGNVAGFDETRTWKIEITNTRQLPVEIEITRGFDTAYWKLQMGDAKEISYEKHDATHARFKTTLDPQSKRILIYTVTTYHGRRQESATK